jgi:tetratricopeptide (TPR) repeat protein
MPTVEQLERILAADPGDAFVLYALAQEHAKLRAFDKALVYYDRCLGVDRLYCYAYFHKAKVLEFLGRIDEARTTLTAGVAAAREAGDMKALSEISGALDLL